MRARAPRISMVAAAALALALPRRGEAVTRVEGNVFAEDASATGPGDDSNLVQTGVNLNVVPQTKKTLKLNLNMRFDYVRSDEQELATANLSPFGNIALDLAGDAYNLNLQHNRYATLGTTSELTETELSRASVSVVPKDLPHVSASISRTDSTTGSRPAATTDTGSVTADYRFRWLELRAGFSADRRGSGGRQLNESSSRFVGMGATGQVAPATVLGGDVQLDRFEASSTAGASSATQTRTVRLNGETQPLAWLGFTGNFSRSAVEVRSGTVLPRSTQQFAEVGTSVLPHPSLRLAVSAGNRQFNDVQTTRSVDFRTVAASFSRELRDRILFGANASRSFQSDPSQGKNVADSFGVNTAAHLTSRISLRLNANVSHSESRTFVSAQRFNASGTLAERDQLDTDAGGLPAGFIFFDTVNGDLYTKNSSAIGDWSLPVHVDLVVGSYSVTRSIDVTATPTDRTNLTLGYTSNASAEDLDLAKVGSQTFNGSFSYMATRRSNLGLSAIASFPERRGRAISGTGAYSYRFSRGHQLNLSYSIRSAAGRQNEIVAASLRLNLRKRVAMEFSYSATDLFEDASTHFVRARATHSF